MEASEPYGIVPQPSLSKTLLAAHRVCLKMLGTHIYICKAYPAAYLRNLIVFCIYIYTAYPEAYPILISIPITILENHRTSYGFRSPISKTHKNSYAFRSPLSKTHKNHRDSGYHCRELQEYAGASLVGAAINCPGRLRVGFRIRCFFFA